MISPGTPLRQGLDNILKAKTGGLIVLATSEEIMEVVDGGFCINAEYSPAYIYELAKMDGAIVLSGDIKKILFRQGAGAVPVGIVRDVIPADERKVGRPELRDRKLARNRERAPKRRGVIQHRLLVVNIGKAEACQYFFHFVCLRSRSVGARGQPRAAL